MGKFRILWIRLRMLVALFALAVVLMVVSTHAFWQNVYPISYYQIIQREAKQMHVDPLLIAALVRVESHFREDDISHAGAVGLMQLMPSTALWIAGQTGQSLKPPSSLGTNVNSKDSAYWLSNPSVNVRLGSWYMAYLLKIFHNRLPEAVAAYNAGPNRVQRWISEGTWTGNEMTSDDIPVRETRHFLARVMYTYDIFKRYYQ